MRMICHEEWTLAIRKKKKAGENILEARGGRLGKRNLGMCRLHKLKR